MNILLFAGIILAVAGFGLSVYNLLIDIDSDAEHFDPDNPRTAHEYLVNNARRRRIFSQHADKCVGRALASGLIAVVYAALIAFLVG